MSVKIPKRKVKAIRAIGMRQRLKCLQGLCLLATLKAFSFSALFGKLINGGMASKIDFSDENRMNKGITVFFETIGVLVDGLTAESL